MIGDAALFFATITVVFTRATTASFDACAVAAVRVLKTFRARAGYALAGRARGPIITSGQALPVAACRRAWTVGVFEAVESARIEALSLLAEEADIAVHIFTAIDAGTRDAHGVRRAISVGVAIVGSAPPFNALRVLAVVVDAAWRRGLG